MLVTHTERPRELKWYHAGPMLYGDWGTSRFYVLGLAFYYALYSSFWYVLGVCMLVAAVGWAYTVVCKSYPDGGGVYSAARQLSPTLSVIGALLLFADYAVTAALSAFEGMHYFQAEGRWTVAFGAIAGVLLLGLINYVGPKKAGMFALLIAMATLVLTLILALFALPYLPEGIHNIQPMQGTLSHRWITLVHVVLALSGVEAIANMTGIMVQPVGRTSKKSIYPVMAEILLLNIVLAIAMLAIKPVNDPSSNHKDFAQPAAVYDEQRAQVQEKINKARALAADHPAIAADVTRLEASLAALPEKSRHENRVQTTVLVVMGEQFIGEQLHPAVGKWFGVISGVVFGLLLFSAVNTVIGGMISVQYVMSRDKELPHFFTKLNMFGVPWLGLLPALAIPVVLLLLFSELEQLADLYAIGVVGAIAINLTSCTINKRLNIKKWERVLMGVIALVMCIIEITIAVEKLHALIFVLIILGAGLGMRFVTKTLPAIRAKLLAGPTPEELATGRYRGVEVAAGKPAAEPLVPVSALGTPAEQLDMAKPHIMVATRGGPRLMDFAANYTRQVGGILFVLYVRPFNVQFTASTAAPSLDEDPEARRIFELAAEACRKANVPMVPIYIVSPDVAYSILDFAATYNVEALLMGVSRKGTLLRALQGDVLTNVADNLPQDIPLLIHA